MKAFAAILCVALGACGGVWHPQRDGVEVMTVTWVRSSPSMLGHVCGERTAGCSKQTAENACTIYAPVPDDDLDERSFSAIGEEVAHCFYGDFH